MSIRHVLPVLLAVSATLVADEERFNPPLRGGYLGIRVKERKDGLVVNHLDADGAGSRGGLKVGDLLRRFGAREHLGELGITEFVKFLRGIPAGQTYEVEVLRDGKSLTLRLEPDSTLTKDAHELARRLREHRFFKALEDRRELLERMDAKLRAAVRGCRRHQEAYDAINKVIDELDVSHTAIIPPWVYSNVFAGDKRDKGHFHLGAFFQRVKVGGEPRYFVHSVMFGSQAKASALRIGDEIVSVNGRPFDDSPRKTLAGYESRHEIYTIQIDRDEDVHIGYRRRQNGDVAFLDLKADSELGAVTSTKLSVRMLDAPHDKLGYIHLWNLLGRQQTRVFDQALRGKLASAKGLVVDLRGRGGQVPVLLAIGQRLIKDGRPAVLLLDAETRSAKEVLAYRLKGKRGMTLVGETTAGAVRPAGYVKLPSGTYVMIPVERARSVVHLTDGIDLEGRGVTPDVVVDFVLPYSAGRDIILERSVEILEVAIVGHARRRRI